MESSPFLAEPTGLQERISSLDVLRGAAVLGILVMNIYAFALPRIAYENPLIYGGTDSLNYTTWFISYLFFDMKFMTIFSMLFGAGLILMVERLESKGVSFKKIYFRRILWLLLIGLIHAYLLWAGDILVTYACCGFILYLFRKKSARFLIVFGLCAVLLGGAMHSAAGFFMDYIKTEAAEIQLLIQEGTELDKDQQDIMEIWEQTKTSFNPSQSQLEEEIATHKGSYSEILQDRVPFVVKMQTQAFLFLLVWRIGGVMLIGMGLMKLGIFSAERSRKFYLIVMILGYGIGLPVIFMGVRLLMIHEFNFAYQLKAGELFNYFGSLLVAMGHISLIMLVCKSSILQSIKSKFAAVGRMALTNYLMHTIIFTSIFYGYGLGFFADFDRFVLMLFVVGVWILQLFLSPVWLKYFRFGPAEWLWRSLTYRKIQPLRK